MRLARPFVITICLVLALIATATAATVPSVLAPAPVPTLRVTTGDVEIPTVGETVEVPVVLEAAPNGLAGYEITVALSDPSIAEITAVDFPTWTIVENADGSFSYFNNSASLALPASTVTLKAADVKSEVPLSATDVTLVTLTIRGLAAGITRTVITPDPSLGIEDRNGDLYPIYPLQGTVIVGETPTEATAALIVTVQGFDLPPLLETALTDKLNAAITAADLGYNKAAGNSMNAFVNQVKAQRGKALTAPDADALITKAVQLKYDYGMLNPQPEPPL